MDRAKIKLLTTAKAMIATTICEITKELATLYRRVAEVIVQGVR